MKKIYLAKSDDLIDEKIKKLFKNDGDGYYIEDTIENRLKYENILPFGYSSNKKSLRIDLIPKTSWGASLANSLDKKSWDSIRKPFISMYGNRCQICGQKGVSLSQTIRDVDTHEIWEYSPLNENPKIQKLVGFLSVCSSCHLMFHLGFAGSINKSDTTIKRIQKLEGLSKSEVSKRIDSIFNLWSERSRHEWIIDISILREYGFENIAFKEKAKKISFIY